MANNIGFDFTRNVSRALKDKQLRKNFKFAMGNFILKRQQIFPDKNGIASLDDWKVVEERYPDTFVNMYNFICRRKH